MGSVKFDLPILVRSNKKTNNNGNRFGLSLPVTGSADVYDTFCAVVYQSFQHFLRERKTI